MGYSLTGYLKTLDFKCFYAFLCNKKINLYCSLQYMGIIFQKKDQNKPLSLSFVVYYSNNLHYCNKLNSQQKKRTRNNFCLESSFYCLSLTIHVDTAHGCTCKKITTTAIVPLRTLFMIVMTFCFFFTSVITFFFIAVSKHDPVWCHEHCHTQEKESCGT